jgi:hypothetical protein
VVTVQLDTRCCRVNIVLCFSLLLKNAFRHKILKQRQEIPDFSVAKNVEGRASCERTCQKRMYWGK